MCFVSNIDNDDDDDDDDDPISSHPISFHFISSVLYLIELAIHSSFHDVAMITIVAHVTN